ncbi:MAG: hypothetical protein ACQESL_09960 [Bacteroidota bacterium]
MDTLKALLDNKWLDHDNIKIDRKRIGFAGLVIWIAFITLFFSNSLFENIGLNDMWHLGFTFMIINAIILYLVVKGLIESYLWNKVQQE